MFVKLLTLTNKFENRQFLRYLIVGIWNACFSILVFYAFLYFFGFEKYQFAILFTFFLSTIQSYLSQSKFIWRQPLLDAKRFAHFGMVCLVQYLCNAFLMFICVALVRIPPNFSQIPVSSFIAISSYFYFKTFVFQMNRRVRQL